MIQGVRCGPDIDVNIAGRQGSISASEYATWGLITNKIPDKTNDSGCIHYVELHLFTQLVCDDFTSLIIEDVLGQPQHDAFPEFPNELICTV